VGKQNTVGNPSSLTVSVSWRLTLAPHRRAAEIAQDLYLSFAKTPSDAK